MNGTSVPIKFTPVLVAVLAALVAALLAVFVLAKPSGAQGTQITVEPMTVGVGADEVDGTVSTSKSSILVTNTGSSAVQIGGVNADINIPNLNNLGDFDLLTTVKNAITGVPLPGDINTGVTLGAGETAELQVSLNASAKGTRDAVLKLTDDAGNLLEKVNLTGTGVNQLPAAAPDCTHTGTNGRDKITGTAGPDVICALGGNDVVNPLGGNDTARGGGGKDRLKDKASADADSLYGQGSVDTLNAKDGDGNDEVNGGAKRDRVRKDKADQGRRR